MPHRRPSKTGLYDPAFEHDSCGVALVARLSGEPSRETVAKALTALSNLEHRGAQGADADTGDGAGILVQVPDAFFRAVFGRRLPPAGAYGVGTCFLPQDGEARRALEQVVERTIAAEGQVLLGWRDVPIEPAHVGRAAICCRASYPAAVRRRLARAFGRPGRVRAQALRDPAGGGARRRAGARRAEPLLPHARLQGDADGAAARALLSRPERPGLRERRSRSCTRATRRTRSRAGSSRTRTG